MKERPMSPEPTRPEWIKCVEHDHADLRNKSWCGRDVRLEFRFSDIDHAAESGRQEGRLVACPECVTAIIAALRTGHDIER